MKKSAIFLILMLPASLVSFAQGNGMAGISEATNMVTSYFDPLTKLIFAVAAVLGEQCPIPMRRVGVRDVFGHSGPAWELLEQFGLRSDAIIAAVKELV